jgi:integrase
MRVRYKSGCVFLQNNAWYFRAGRKSKAIRLGSIEQLKNQTQARKAAQPFVNQANELKAIPVATFGAVIERYKLEEMPPRKCTARMYKSWLKLYIEPRWSTTPVNQVTAYEVKLWLESLTLGGKSKSEIKGMIGRLLRCAMLWQLIPNGPNEMELFQVKGRKRKKKARILPVREFISLVDKLDEPFRTMACIALFQGLRVSEVLGLKWGDIDWFKDELTIQRSVVAQTEDTTKTEASAAKLPLDQRRGRDAPNWRARSEFTRISTTSSPRPISPGKSPTTTPRSCGSWEGNRRGSDREDRHSHLSPHAPSLGRSVRDSHRRHQGHDAAFEHRNHDERLRRDCSRGVAGGSQQGSKNGPFGLSITYVSLMAVSG